MKRRGRPLLPSLGHILLGVTLGSAFLPTVLVGAIFTLTRGHVSEGPVIRALVASGEVAKAVAPGPEGTLVLRRDYASPAWLDLVVADARGLVVFSTLPSTPPGTRPDLGRIAAFAESLVPRATFITDRVELGGREAGTWYAILPSDAARSLAGQAAPLLRLSGLAAFALVALFLGLGASAMLATQVRRLERAARAIAEGDLETPVRAWGAREIVSLSEAMESLRSSIREDIGRRARFLAAVSHDLRTPLTSIGGYLEAIEDGLASEPATLAHYVAIMKDRTRLLEERVQGLIDFARMETGEWRLRFQRLALAPLFGSFAEAAREECALAGLAFEARLAALGAVDADVDAALLGRAFENLVTNGLRHGGGILRLGARFLAEGPALAVDVDDEGPGVPPAERALVFEPFWKGSASREGVGSGLGLHIAKSIIEGHGWTLGLGESPSGGARFTIHIPLPAARNSEPRAPGGAQGGRDA